MPPTKLTMLPPLTLDIRDLEHDGQGSEGVRFWFWKRTPDSPAVQSIAWPHTIILGVRVRWPHGCHPENEDGFRDAGLRVMWHPDMAEFYFENRCQVPDVNPVAELRRGDLERLEVTSAHHGRLKSVATSSVYWIDGKAMPRLRAALGMDPYEGDWRLGQGLVLLYKQGDLRAVCVVKKVEHGRKLARRIS